MFTLKATAYLSLAIALLALALFLDDFQIGVLILGLGSIFFLSNIWGIPERIQLEMTREVNPNETFGGEDIRVESRIRNLTKFRLVDLEAEEYLDSRLVPQKGTNRIRASISAEEEFRLTFEFPSPPRSNYKIGPLTVHVRDPFGFYLHERRLGDEDLSVMPRPERLSGTQLKPRYVGPWPGVIPSKLLGNGTEFYSMRDYVSGDDLKRINWKASARYNSLMVNQMETERVTDVMLVLDTDVTFFSATEDELFEREIMATASIASFLLSQGNRVGLVLQGGERGSIPASFGKRHERRILYLLADAKPGKPTVSTSYVMNLLARRMLPSRAQIVVVSPLLDPEVKEGIIQLSVEGYSILVLSPRPIPPDSFKDLAEKTAFKLIMLERSIAVLSLQRFTRMIDWPREIPLSVMLTKVRRLRPLAAA